MLQLELLLVMFDDLQLEVASSEKPEVEVEFSYRQVLPFFMERPVLLLFILI